MPDTQPPIKVLSIQIIFQKTQRTILPASFPEFHVCAWSSNIFMGILSYSSYWSAGRMGKGLYLYTQMVWFFYFINILAHILVKKCAALTPILTMTSKFILLKYSCSHLCQIVWGVLKCYFLKVLNKLSFYRQLG